MVDGQPELPPDPLLLPPLLEPLPDPPPELLPELLPDVPPELLPEPLPEPLDPEPELPSVPASPGVPPWNVVPPHAHIVASATPSQIFERMARPPDARPLEQPRDQAQPP